jgi:hypothetical protein
MIFKIIAFIAAAIPIFLFTKSAFEAWDRVSPGDRREFIMLLGGAVE